MGCKRVALILAGLSVVGAVGIAGEGTAFADGTASGPSGVTYRIDTICSTGEMQISSSEVAPSQSVTVTLAEMSGSWKTDIGLGGYMYHSFSYTLDKSIAMDPVGVVVKENGKVVTSASYFAKCSGFQTQQGTALRSAFVPVAPDRILDTRPSAAVNYAGAKPSAGAGVELSVIGGKSAVPANATAVVLNVTAVDATAPGYVQAFPTGRSTPGASSNLNIERAGQTIPNAVIVPVGNNGKVTLFTEAGTHLIADISGYFAPTSGPVAAGRYLSVTTKRVLDSRSAAKPAAGAKVKFSVVVSGAPPVGQIAAVALNVTATDSTAAGYVQAAAAGQLVPGASSNLNLERAGQTIPNLVIVPVSAAGEVEIFTESGTHLLADVMGYYTSSAAPASQSGLFVPATPERILDTRGTNLGGGDYEAADGGSIYKDFGGLDMWKPAAVVLNVTATGTTEAGYVQVGNGVSMVQGGHSNLNMEVGQTIPNAVITPIGSYPDAMEIYNAGASDLLADFAGWFTS